MPHPHPIRLTALAAAITLLHLGVQAQTAQARWRIESIPTLGGSYSTASAVNNSGQVTGSAMRLDGFNHAYRYTQGLMEDLQPFPSVNGTGTAINAAGSIAGTAWSPNGSVSVGFAAYADGSVVNFSLLPDNSFGKGINDRGVVLVEQASSQGPTSYISTYDQANGYRTLTLQAQGQGPILNLEGSAYGINAAGQVAGTNYQSNYTFTATLPEAAVTGFRLEILEDASLPTSGPGRATNGNIVLSEFRVSRAVTVFNQPPVATADSFTTPRNEPIVITTTQLISNDLHPEADPFVFNTLQTPANGTAVLAGSNITYTPALDFGGGRNPDGQGFSAFGRLVEGLDVARRIQMSPANAEERLTPPVAIRSARIEGQVPPACHP